MTVTGFTVMAAACRRDGHGEGACDGHGGGVRDGHGGKARGRHCSRARHGQEAACATTVPYLPYPVRRAHGVGDCWNSGRRRDGHA